MNSRHLHRMFTCYHRFVRWNDELRDEIVNEWPKDDFSKLTAYLPRLRMVLWHLVDNGDYLVASLEHFKDKKFPEQDIVFDIAKTFEILFHELMATTSALYLLDDRIHGRSETPWIVMSYLWYRHGTELGQSIFHRVHDRAQYTHPSSYHITRTRLQEYISEGIKLEGWLIEIKELGIQVAEHFRITETILTSDADKDRTDDWSTDREETDEEYTMPEDEDGDWACSVM